MNRSYKAMLISPSLMLLLWVAGIRAKEALPQNGASEPLVRNDSHVKRDEYGNAPLAQVAARANSYLACKMDEGPHAIPDISRDTISKMQKMLSTFVIEGRVDVVNDRNSKGQTALMLLAMNPIGPQIAAFLVLKGADVEIRDQEGKSAMDYAQYKCKGAWHPVTQKQCARFIDVLRDAPEKNFTKIVNDQEKEVQTDKVIESIKREGFTAAQNVLQENGVAVNSRILKAAHAQRAATKRAANAQLDALERIRLLMQRQQ